MKKIIAIFIGGMLGGGVRSLIVPFGLLANGFPLGTLMVNLIGCFLMAYLSGFVAEVLPLSPAVVLGMTTGLIGALTTFSSFSMESLTLITHQQIWLAVSYDAISLIGGLGSALLGITIAKRRLMQWQGRQS